MIRDKNSYPLRVRDDIYLNDVVQTSSSSTLGITFNDATTFNLSASSKITIDNYVYEDGGKSNAAIFDVAKGTAAFVAAAFSGTSTTPVVPRMPSVAVGVAIFMSPVFATAAATKATVPLPMSKIAEFCLPPSS